MPKVIEKKKKNKKKLNFTTAIAHIQTTFNNTIVTFTDLAGNAFIFKSAGIKNQFKGAKKSTPYAAQVTSEEAARLAVSLGIKTVIVKIKGTGGGREAAIRALNSAGLHVISIEDVTPVAHNGCRPQKRPRG